MNDFDLYKYLKSQFSNLEDCKKWFREWWRNGQEIEGVPYDFTLRAMAYHCSMVLEGYDDDPNKEHYFTDYMETKYGLEIYFCL